jgi:heme-degrading monooxygenase HmoA
MSQLYTHAIWTARPGREEEFVAAWSEFADWTEREVSADATGKLLRDTSTPNRFISFGPWESLEQIEDWRARDGWKERVARLRELLDGFEPSTLEQVAGAR